MMEKKGSLLRVYRIVRLETENKLLQTRTNLTADAYYFGTLVLSIVQRRSPPLLL